jgi:lysyl-tRNA synthetase class 1
MSDAHRVFWADEVADRIEARDPADPIVIKGGISPSGVPHLGNMNEIMRGYFVAAVLRERGHEVRQVFTADDRDPLRSVPRKLATLEGEVVGLDAVDAGALGRNLGRPYTDVPDPFGCCDSYGDHFSTFVERAAEQLGVPDFEVVSNTDLYESGEMEAVTASLLDQTAAARDLLSEYQAGVGPDYVPFTPICGACGRLTGTVTDYDAAAGTVAYRCTDVEAGDRVIEGCGHEGTATLREGKLPWRFEWPAQWRVLGVDFEPFGKDHAEGSWPSGQEIATSLLDTRPPVPMTYEWFTLDGEPFSSSAGNVVLVSEVLEYLEREVLRYFFAKDPTKARDFDRSRVDQLVDEFDRFERLYVGEETGSEREEALADRVYPFVVDEVRPDRVRLPYTFAAVLGMTDDRDLRVRMAENEGHLPADADPETVAAALDRVPKARTWASRQDNEYNYRLQSELPDVSFERALDDLATRVAATPDDGEAIQGAVYETAEAHGVETGAFFAAGYRLFFGQDSGPKLGPLLAQLDGEFVVARLRRTA